MMKQVNMNRIRGGIAALGAVVVLVASGCGGCRETSNTPPIDTWVNYVPGGSTDPDDRIETGASVPVDPPSSDHETVPESEPATESSSPESETEGESEPETETGSIVEEGIKLATPRGALYYSAEWEEILTQPRQSQEEELWVVSFGVTLGGTEYPLFDILIGEEDVRGLACIGHMTDSRGETYAVYVRIPSDEQIPTRENMYWKQYCAAKEEQINFIMSHLA